jgi:hypothetical protein
VALKRDSLSLMSTTEELFERKSSGSRLEIREYGRRDPSRGLRSLGRYSSLVDSGYKVCFLYIPYVPRDSVHG